MKKSLSGIFIVFAFVLITSFALCGVESGYAWDDSDEYEDAYNYSGAYNDAYQTSQNTAAFDGGSGSTINTSVSQSYPVGDVPDVGEGRAYGYQDQDGNYHSY